MASVSNLSASLQIYRPGIILLPNQQLQLAGYVATNSVPHPYPVVWIQPVIPAGTTVSIIIFSTGGTTLNVPAGYTGTFLETSYNFSEDIEGFLFVDGLMFAEILCVANGTPHYISKIVGYSTAYIDPLGLNKHTIAVTLTNKGQSPCSGGIEFSLILQEVGSLPLPTSKDTVCPFCHNINKMKTTESNIKCSICGQAYITSNPNIRKS